MEIHNLNLGIAWAF